MTDVRWLFVLHGVLWSAFGVRVAAGMLRKKEPATEAQPAKTAPFSRTVVWLHSVAFGLLYFSLFDTLFGRRPVPQLFPFQELVGGGLILLSAGLTAWALYVFRSWKLRAQLGADHQLCTAGPFGWVRHPIYLAMNLMMLGSALWIPTALTWLAVFVCVVTGDIRGRVEEKILLEAFGERYRELMTRVKRFVPGVY